MLHPCTVRLTNSNQKKMIKNTNVWRCKLEAWGKQTTCISRKLELEHQFHYRKSITQEMLGLKILTPFL